MEGHERILHIPASFPLSDLEIKVVLDRAGAAKLAKNARLEIVFVDGTISKNLLTVNDNKRDSDLVGGTPRRVEF